MQWTAGDVLGFAADFDAGALWLGLNGKWEPQAAITGCEWPSGLFPAFTGEHLLLEIHLGAEAQMRYPGPGARFRPWLADCCPTIREADHEPRELVPSPIAHPANFHMCTTAAGE